MAMKPPLPLAAAALAALVLRPSALPAQPPPSSPERAPVEAAPVEAAAVEEAEVSETAVLFGSLEPRRASVVASAIEGKVLEYPAREGRRVKEGDLLARLSDDILVQELKGAQAALAEAREWLAKAGRDLKRARELAEKDAATQKDLDAAETAERTQALRLPRVEAEVEALRLNLEKKQVRAPFDGQVVRELTEVGEWLPAGGAVARLVDLSSVFVRFNVPERHIRFFKEGQSVPVTVEAAGPKPYLGRVASIAGEGDSGARTFPVRLEIQNDGSLRAGMSARAEFPVGERRKALLVPKDAVLLEAGQSQVFLVVEGAAQKRRIETGAAHGDRLEVVRGLARGDLVVVKGNERIQPGSPVRLVRPPPSPSPAPLSPGPHAP
jgi:membrane fusion protein (multidrug efflux system)